MGRSHSLSSPFFPFLLTNGRLGESDVFALQADFPLILFKRGEQVCKRGFERAQDNVHLGDVAAGTGVGFWVGGSRRETDVGAVDIQTAAVGAVVDKGFQGGDGGSEKVDDARDVALHLAERVFVQAGNQQLSDGFDSVDDGRQLTVWRAKDNAAQALCVRLSKGLADAGAKESGDKWD